MCLKLVGLLTGSILYVSIQSLALNRWASGLSPGVPLKIGGDNFTLGGGGAGPPEPGVGIPAAAACMAATIWASRAASVGAGPRGPGGPTGPASPAGPTGPSMDGGGGGGGITAPPPAPPPGGGMGVAISKTQCNNELNPTLVVDNWSMF